MKKIMIFLSIFLLNNSGKMSIYCDIKGSVNNPGVYEIKTNYTINDIIKDAGGLKNDSYTNKINLSKKVKDEMVIYIPSKTDIEKIKLLENCDCSKFKKNCNEENIEIKNTIETTTTTSKQQIETTTTTSKQQIETTTTKEQTTKQITEEKIFPININTCNISDLLKIKGLGEIKATKIIEYRELNGLFNNIEEIKNVNGIGDVLFNKIKEFITV